MKICLDQSLIAVFFSIQVSTTRVRIVLSKGVSNCGGYAVWCAGCMVQIHTSWSKIALEMKWISLWVSLCGNPAVDDETRLR